MSCVQEMLSPFEGQDNYISYLLLASSLTFRQSSYMLILYCSTLILTYLYTLQYSLTDYNPFWK